MKNHLLLFSLLLAVSLTAGAQSSTRVTITPSATYQTMRSFGASDCWTAEYVGRCFTDAEKQKAAQWLFSSDVDASGNPLGIALTEWRVNLGGGSATQGDNSNISDKTRRADCYLDKDGKTYKWTNCAGQQWFMQQAKEYGVPNFLLFSNAPLIYYTSNGLANNKGGLSGSILESDKYDDFADYLAECVNHFTAEGYNISMIDPVNEPAFDWKDGQEGSPWTNSEMARLVRELDKSLTAKSLNTQILIPEASSWDRLYQQCSDYGGRASNQIEAFWNAANTDTYVGDLAHLAPIAAGHSYWTFRTNDDLQKIRTSVWDKAKAYNLETAQTEWSMLDKEPATSAGFPASYDAASYMDIALYMGKLIYSDLTYANVSSWSYWSAMAQEKWSQKNRFYLLRLNAPGDNGNESYGDIEQGGTVSDSKNLWVLGNYSRFIRPGYKRVAVSVPNSGLNGLMATAFVAPDNSEAVVVFVNMGYMRRNVSFNIDGYNVTSVDTYTTDAKNNLAHASIADGKRFNLARGTVTTAVMKITPTTGIRDVAVDDDVDDVDDAVYNLNGMRVDADNLPHGVFISNGKKFVNF